MINKIGMMPPIPPNESILSSADKPEEIKPVKLTSRFQRTLNKCIDILKNEKASTQK